MKYNTNFILENQYTSQMIELLIMVNQNQVIVVCDDHRRCVTTLRYCMVNSLVSTTIPHPTILNVMVVWKGPHPTILNVMVVWK